MFSSLPPPPAVHSQGIPRSCPLAAPRATSHPFECSASARDTCTSRRKRQRGEWRRGERRQGERRRGERQRASDMAEGERESGEGRQDVGDYQHAAPPALLAPLAPFRVPATPITATRPHKP